MVTLKKRISRKVLYMSIAKLMSQRSTCTKKHVGAVLVKDKRIIATGYNGVLPNRKPETGLDEDGTTHTVHAEANLIAFCARYGIETDGCILYISLSPCEKCAELIVQSGIKEVIFEELYRDAPTALYSLEFQDIKVTQMDA